MSEPISPSNGICQPIVFTGNGTEYAKIFFVNLALTILTLGVYSAWAKVRRKRYFYANTLLAGSSFDYHASPIQILKGRALVVGVFIAYNVGVGLMPTAAGIFGLLFFAFIPWMILKSTQFNMRNSSYRQIRFDFKGDMGVMFGLYVILPVLAVFTLWLAYPYVAYKQKDYYVNRTYFGKSPFSFVGTSREFFVTYYKVYFSILAIVVILAFSFGNFTKAFAEGFSEAIKKRIEHTAPQHLGDISNKETRIQQVPSEKSEQMTPSETKQSPMDKNLFKALVALFVVVFYAAVLLIALIVMTYINTRITNYVFNNLKLRYMRFSSKIKYSRLMWIYATNTVFILLTLGIFIPWAKVRAVKYKLSCIDAYVLDMENYIAEESENVKAIGEEFSDIFDVDVGL